MGSNLRIEPIDGKTIPLNVSHFADLQMLIETFVVSVKFNFFEMTGNAPVNPMVFLNSEVLG